jgi:hypothetical protein
MRLILILTVAQTIGYMFPQEIMIQPILQNGSEKLMLVERSGITVHPGDSLYLEVSSSIPSHIEFFHHTAPVNIAITEGSTIVFQESYTGIRAFNQANIIRAHANHFQRNRKLVFNFGNKQGLKEIVLPIK